MSVRVRFAPSPTGFMHLGNVRTALLNFIFARSNGGTFIVRIEDTDPERLIDPQARKLLSDLEWLSLKYDEGPGKETSTNTSYFQSERTALYQIMLEKLQTKNCVYRCFCTAHDLEQKRVRALALKQAPRYDRTCTHLTSIQIEQNIASGIPFVWRFRLPENSTVHVQDMARGTIPFDLNNFSDFPLNRSDGSFTFMFANCVDDIEMRITHVLRGEDHLSNTANQVALYQALGYQTPIFWHLPILCNAEGKKLSKRDFGFSLTDLANAGFLPEAICNYLAIIGASFENEIMNLDELVKALSFEALHASGTIRYDVEKLKWVNHQWIRRLPLEMIASKCSFLLKDAYPEFKTVESETYHALIKLIKDELVTINDCIAAARFFFIEPTITRDTLLEHLPAQAQQAFEQTIQTACKGYNSGAEFVALLKSAAKQTATPISTLLQAGRLLLTETRTGPSLTDIIDLLGKEKTIQRASRFLI